MSQRQSLSTIWTSKLKGHEKETLEHLLKNNSTLILRFLEIVDQYEQEELREQSNKEQYDSPSWAYMQADRNGALRALKKIRTLFNHMET